jgi:hypothetical protein
VGGFLHGCPQRRRRLQPFRQELVQLL